MSRAYRLRISESLKRVVHAEDHVSTQLEMLEILPAEQMAELLEQELSRRGFAKKDDVLVRSSNGVTVEVDPCSATVKVKAEGQESLSLTAETSAVADREWNKELAAKAKGQAAQELKIKLENQAREKVKALQRKITAKLEGELTDVRKELDQAINRVTADALKQKAAQLGQIKEVTEDPQTGSMTIVLEV